jgi:hypothetical protein
MDLSKLNGLQWKSFWNSQLGCLKGCSEYLGIDMSDAWLFGGTGVAFILQMDEQGFGAGGPWYQGQMMNLCNNLGFTVNGVYGFKKDEDFPIKQQMAWENTKGAIDRGYPCYGYNLAIPEYFVVYGYENEGYSFTGFGVDNLSGRNEQRIFILPPELKGRLSVYGEEGYVPLEDAETNAMLIELASTRGYHLKGSLRMVNNGDVREIISDNGDWIILQGEGLTPWKVLGTMHIGLLEMYWLEPGRSSNPKDVVKESLEFALEFAESPRKWVYPPYKAGLDAYDLWINAVEGDNPNIFALSYNSQCWAECRKHAVDFLKEAADRIGGATAVLLNEAANRYQEIYFHLQAAADLLPFEGKSDDHYKQPERFVQLAVHIKQAKQAEKAALNQLSKIVAAL